MSGATSETTKLSDEQADQFDQISEEIYGMAERRKVTTALASLDSIRDNVPDARDYDLLHAALLSIRADLCLDIGEIDQAWDNATTSLDGGWEQPEVFDVAGWAAYGRDRPETAREYFDSALSRDSDLVSSLMGRSLALQDIGEYDHARSDLTHALNLEPDNPELHALRSEVFTVQSMFDEAERDIERARELAPSDPEYSLTHARLLLVQGRVDEACEAIDAAVESGPTSMETLLLRSHLHLLEGRNEEARADAIRASNHFPDEAFAFVQLTHVQLAQGKLNMARKAADRAVELDPSLPDAYLVRGAAKQMSEGAEAAKEDFERASQAPAELPMFLLGSCYDVLEATGLETSISDLLDRYQETTAEGTDQEAPFGNVGAFGGMDPMSMLGQLFDESGDMKGKYKPFVEMAMKNAPNILKNVPPSLLENVGGLDPSKVDDLDLSELSSDQIEQEMKRFYKMMQSGQNPFENNVEEADSEDDTGEADDKDADEADDETERD